MNGRYGSAVDTGPARTPPRRGTACGAPRRGCRSSPVWIPRRGALARCAVLQPAADVSSGVRVSTTHRLPGYIHVGDVLDSPSKRHRPSAPSSRVGSPASAVRSTRPTRGHLDPALVAAQGGARSLRRRSRACRSRDGSRSRWRAVVVSVTGLGGQPTRRPVDAGSRRPSAGAGPGRGPASDLLTRGAVPRARPWHDAPRTLLHRARPAGPPASPVGDRRVVSKRVLYATAAAAEVRVGGRPGRPATPRGGS